MRSVNLAAAVTLGAAAVLVPAHAGTAAPAPPRLTAHPLIPANRVTGTKSATSRLARTDRTLLGRHDTTPLPVLVKLDYDPLATYAGGVAGYAATSPSATGHPLSGSAGERRYTARTEAVEGSFAAALSRRVPGARVGQRLRTVYGGVALTVPANRIADVLALPGVVAVQRDALRQPLTDSSPGFIGAPALYPKPGGAPDAGKGVLFGVLDTGVWPEHPSFADKANLAAPPPKADGTARTCDFGDNPLTPQADPFPCNRKLVGGAAFLTTYLSDPVRAAGERYHSARDSGGHGTHTASTAAGDVVAAAPLLGVDRGPIAGIAPGAWVSVYKICGAQGCFGSDSAAAVGQAVLDGVRVINFSVSGGADPFTDPVELAFLDAYAAGVFVAASAGNEGPQAGTANHLSPWVTTVGASTQRREFSSTLTLTAPDGAVAAFSGASVTAGAGPAPVVPAGDPPYGHPLCDVPADAGSLAGKIVACQRGGNPRVSKGWNVLQGGAAGTVLYNPALADTETDNHWLPAVHLPDGTAFLSFLTANPGTTGQFTAGRKVSGRGDVMASFSSRGPAGNLVKPDITAPGVQILAGNTPTPEGTAEGPPGQYFQAIAGTSMSSPHIAGSAILLRALHPQWTPGQLKSALMTTASQRVVKPDGSTPADPFDDGSGRVDLTVAGAPGLTFDETAARMAALGNDPLNAVHLNLPSVDVPVLPGRLTTVRRATNVSGKLAVYRVETSAPARSSITVKPDFFVLGPGQAAALSITVASSAPTGQYFGEIRLVPQGFVPSGLPPLHLPVAFVPRQGDVHLSSTCSPSTVDMQQAATCTVTASNASFADATVDLATTTSLNLPIVDASGADLDGATVRRRATLTGVRPGVPSIGPGGLFGYVPLAGFGVVPTPIGDEDLVNLHVPTFVYSGQTFDTIGVDSNGYLVVGGGTAEDNQPTPPGIPDPAPPDNVLAPLWTDLDGTGEPGVYAATLTDGISTWIVLEWQVHVFGTASNRHFQVWIGTSGSQDITFAYDPAALPTDPGLPFTVGAENVNGSGGQQLPAGVLPTGDLRVTSSAPTPGGSVSYRVTVRGLFPGTGTVTSTMTSPAVPGTTVVTSDVVVR